MSDIMRSKRPEVALLQLPLEVLADVCLQLDLLDLVRIAQTCKRFRHGDIRPESAELPTKSPVVTALSALTFSRPELVPSARLIGASESWVAYLTRCTRQRRCREAPTIVAGNLQSMFVDGFGRLLACGQGHATGLGDGHGVYLTPTFVPAMIGVRVRSMAAGYHHGLALAWDGRVFSWGMSDCGQLGHGDMRNRPQPTPVEGLDSVRDVAAAAGCSLAAAQSGSVFHWGCSLQLGARDELRPTIVEGLQGVRVHRVCVGREGSVTFAIGDNGEIFSWGFGKNGVLGYGDRQNQPSPKRVDALRGVAVSSIAVGRRHAVALAQDGLVYVWGQISEGAFGGKPA
jgi:alpha-tubulin suppressor-like RCC1 family protein